ncbi:hypothetical protein H6G54_28280 [Anabaena cylindrica FACHB-243]|uniref:Uncharacterized protein n=1 Tax=Anabaena cylindrica (strain ATCC 27899 / PCC 7122) TaxID=272123 RepID=K9ZCW1_ANACC|nr:MULTISPECIES: hypothetical protein [Anabaena]AFZ57021.1 hypothetical protein Anacy_1514 [Anabaena cylindrica PCC 7122]MBD2421507.1 hypothetical protein [Anabaena cylindrica FACHB-243]MBY5283763.1 hypothetical protein [Anabaena sp. CCAP 1446/1C]MBY5309381.1 hypothetical protein [Anabaena sp. CCAP 1446/1C]MCM2407732.1 hypothetical protein [Anabaena sp. CCAP 1446/1C]
MKENLPNRMLRLYIETHQQMELFDLQSYTSEKPIVTEDVLELVEEIQQPSPYKQLELNLFPQKIYFTHLEMIKLAA